ncbi:ECF transporter S component [Lihuaxuella thermophila]|nr:ECF transporter S component [Lihuaxuella thermophila]
MQHSQRLTKLVFLSLLSGSAFLMQYLDFPLPGFPTFLEIDFSDLPALVGGLVYGPAAGILVEFLKNLLHYLFSGSITGIPIGQMSNFLAGSIFVTVTVLISRKTGNVKGLVYGLVTATILMAAVMTIANWYVIFPAYSILIDWTVTHAQKMSLILYGVAPFNVLKGLLIGFIFIPLYLKLKPYMEQRSLVRG